MRAETGFLTVQFVAAVGLSLVLFTVLANLVVYGYARGVVRAALDEGVRSASRVDGDAATCQARAEAVLADLLGGPMGDGVTLRCEGRRAVADVTLQPWVPGVPAWRFSLAADAVAEEAP